MNHLELHGEVLKSPRASLTVAEVPVHLTALTVTLEEGTMSDLSLDHASISPRSSMSPQSEHFEQGPPVGLAVEVRSEFSGRWVPGFEVTESGSAGYRLMRTSDRAILPAWFSPEQIRGISIRPGVNRY